MAENIKVKPSVALDDANGAVHASYDDAKVAVHNILKGAQETAHTASDEGHSSASGRNGVR